MSFNFGSGPRVEDPTTLGLIGLCAVVIVCLLYLWKLVEALNNKPPEKETKLMDVRNSEAKRIDMSPFMTQSWPK